LGEILTPTSDIRTRKKDFAQARGEPQLDFLNPMLDRNARRGAKRSALKKLVAGYSIEVASDPDEETVAPNHRAGDCATLRRWM